MKIKPITSPRLMGAGVTLIGLIGTIVVSVSLYSSERRSEKRDFGNGTALLAVQVSSEVTRYVDAAQSLAASLGSQTDLTYSDFNGVTAPLQAEQLNGIETVAFVVPTNNAHINDVQQASRVQGYSDLKLVPYAGADTHYFPVYERSLHDDIVATSNIVDLARYPEVVSALNSSRATNQVIVSRALVSHANNPLFAQDQDPTMVLAVPAYGATPTNPSLFKGWVVVGLRAQDISIRALAKSDVRKFDQVNVRGISGNGNPVSIASIGQCSNMQLEQKSCGRAATLVSSHSIEVAQDLWSVETKTKPSPWFFEGARPLLSGLLLACGTIGSILFGVLVYVLAGGRKRALDLVETRTRELDAFAGFAAHDLKAPLTVMSGYIGLIRSGINDPTKLTGDSLIDFCDRTEKASVRMRTLIDDLLTFAKARDIKLAPQVIDLNAAVQKTIDDVLEQHQRQSNGHQPVSELSVQRDMPSLNADRVMVDQLLQNLLSNSVKYVPEGSAPHIDVSARSIEGGWVEVVIADHGIGIPPDRREEVFSGFVRAQNTAGYSGTGLGLAICKRIVERHGGGIHVEENPGGGARFVLTLPAS